MQPTKLIYTQKNKKPMALDDNDTGFQLYLRQIAEYPLLTVKEEVKLARRIKRGDEEARAIMVR